MKNHKLYQRFIACTTTAALAFGAVVPPVAALAQDDAHAVATASVGDVVDGLIAKLMNGQAPTQEELIDAIIVALGEQGITLSKPDEFGFSIVLDLEGDLSGLSVSFEGLLESLGLNIPGFNPGFELDLEDVYALLGLSLDDIQELGALYGGLTSGNPDAVLGFLEATDLDDLTIAEIANQFAEQLAGLLAKLPSMPSIQIPEGGGVHLSDLADLMLQIPFDLDQIAEIFNLPKSMLPAGLKSFNDLKDLNKVISAVSEADLNSFVSIAALLKQLGLDTAKLPKELLDANNIKDPEALMKIWQKLDLNQLVSIEDLLKQFGADDLDLPDELFDANSVKDLETLMQIWQELDLNQLLNLAAILETDEAKAILGDLEIPDSAKDLNNYKDPAKVKEIIDALDLNDVVDILGSFIGVSSEELLTMLDGIDDFNAAKEENGFKTLINALNLDTYAKFVSEKFGAEDVGPMIRSFLGVESLNDLKDFDKINEILKGLLKVGGATPLSTVGSALLSALNLAEQANDSGWICKPDGTWVYWDATAQRVKTGWQKIDGAWYLFDAMGNMQTYWQMTGGKWYFLGSSGAMRTGWQFIWGHWFYLGGADDGAMRTGSFQDSTGAWYRADANGYWIA